MRAPMSGPIRPDDVAELKGAGIPDGVFDAFNEFIAERMSGGSATVMQDEVAARAAAKTGVDQAELFRRGWLDVESSYRAQGWHVEYDKPGYNESYRASFRFTKPRRPR